MTKKRLAQHGRVRSLAVSGWPLRRKMALALAIPLLLAATLGGLRVASDLAESTNSSTGAQQVTVLRPAVTYLTSAEKAMVAAQSTTQGAVTDLDAASKQLRAAATQLSEAADTADLTADQRYQVDALLDLSQAMRAGDSNSLSGATWLAQLRQLQSGVSQLITSIANAQREPQPQLELLSQTLGGRFSLAMQQALAATDRSGETGSQDLFAEIGVEGAAIDRLASGLGDADATTIASLRTANADRSRSVRTGKDDLGGADAYKDYDSLVATQLNGVDTALAEAASSARTRAFANAALTVGALLAAILLALVISRLLLRPIRKVREGALAVAHEQLPEQVRRIRAGEEPRKIEPIDVTTQEEIGQLARAVDDLHRQAVLLASGEASLRAQVSEMFVTLSRRTNTLVNQQLALIETLEKDEEDPRRLESLFRLDHLAARMRRTSDSLVILADAPTHGGIQDALTVGDTMQAATSGVQDYQRVHVGAASSLAVSATAAADVIHLLTELVDNALSFSAPTTAVSLSSTTSANGVTIEVADSGLGVPDQALGDLNRLLRSGGDVTPDTARRMGLFVVSRLAQRHGIQVSLRHNEQHGVTASVVLPPAILAQTVAPVVAAPPAAPIASVPIPVRPQIAAVPTPAPAPAPRPVAEPVADNAPLGLPRRQPGTSDVPGAMPAWTTPAAPPTGAPRLAAVPERNPTPRTAASYLDGPSFVAEEERETPIFRSLRSGWLTADPLAGAWASTEIEEGWERAKSVVSTPVATPVTQAGLPVRRPGARLVPGGVSKPTTTVRDPEVIRARLAAHAAGVSRGRNVAAETGTPDDKTTKAGLS
jgi:signal transduction histidine kinase